MQLIRDALLPPTGHFLLKVYRRGLLVDVVDERNLIVVGSQATHAHLLGGDVTNRSVTQIGYGTGTSAAAFGNTALTSQFAKAIDSATYPATNEVQFAFSLATTEYNGNALSEFGLLTAGGTLYARKVRSSPLNKDVDISLSGTWTISF